MIEDEGVWGCDEKRGDTLTYVSSTFFRKALNIGYAITILIQFLLGWCHSQLLLSIFFMYAGLLRMAIFGNSTTSTISKILEFLETESPQSRGRRY